MGPGTEPCGTPFITLGQLDDLPFMTTCYLLAYSSNLRIFPAMPYDSKFFSNHLWGALSNPFQTSR